MCADIQPDPDGVIYPDSDGKPIGDDTRHFDWIVKIKNNLDIMYHHDPNVFVAGCLLWYARQGDPRVRIDPDVLVAFGRPKGDRGSYKQWLEGGVAPQVVFEVLPAEYSGAEMAAKFHWYDEHGVEEYYICDPHRVALSGWVRDGGRLRAVGEMHRWVSPRGRFRFHLDGPELAIYRPDGQRFMTYVEMMRAIEEDRRICERIERELRDAV